MLKKNPLEFFLPYSKLELKSWALSSDSATCRASIPYEIRSPFFAIMGLVDVFHDNTEIFETTSPLRNHFSMPLLEKYPAATNNYAISFYKHGIYQTLLKMNYIREADLFDLLKDWMLLLKVIQSCVGEEGDIQFYEAVHHLADTFSGHFQQAF
jgi:hypothetical protein